MDPLASDRTQKMVEKSMVTLCLALIACSFYYLRSADPDLWWHIKSGEVIFASGDVPRYDPYSFTAQGQPWIDHEWGTDALFYILYRFSGDLGLTAFKTILGLSTGAMLFLLTRVAHRGAHLLIWVLASDIVAFYTLTRPQMISYFFASFLVLALARKDIIATRVSAGAVIPLIFLAWANLHGGFVAGLALLAAHTGVQFLFTVVRRDAQPEGRKIGNRLILVLAASIVATCLTPYGADLWRLLWREFDVNALNRQYIPEWAPIWLSFGLDGRYFVVMSILVVVGFLLRPDEWRPEEILLVFGVFALSVYSVRHIPFFAIVSARPVARSLAGYFERTPRNVVARLFFIVAFTAALMPAVLKTYFVFLNPSPKIVANSPAADGMPAEAVSFLIANQAAGNLFNPLEWGGYLLWHLPPQLKISIDGRSSMVYPKETLLAHYRFYTNQASTVPPLKLGADFVMVKVKSAVGRSMSSDPQWSAVYRDETVAIFAANTPSGKELIERKRQNRIILPTDHSPHRFP